MQEIPPIKRPLKNRMPITKPLTKSSNFNLIVAAILFASLVAGAYSGYLISGKRSLSLSDKNIKQTPNSAQQDAKTFKDFAEGVIQPKPSSNDTTGYSEGTHILKRPVGSYVTLTSSVVDLSQYEGKKVKVYGQTQKALKEGWLMDVGRVEVIQ